MFKKFFVSWFEDIKYFWAGLAELVDGLRSILLTILYFICFPFMQLLKSIHYIFKYLFYNRYRIRKWTDAECKEVYENMSQPKNYICLGLRLNNKLIEKYLKKRIEKVSKN